MNLAPALLLQAGKMSTSSQETVPASEGGLSRILIIVFLIALACAAVCAVAMVCRGAAGAAKAQEKEKDNQ